MKLPYQINIIAHFRMKVVTDMNYFFSFYHFVGATNLLFQIILPTFAR